MATDRFPELLVDEKNTLLSTSSRATSAVLHPRSRDAMSRVAKNEKGEFHAVEDVAVLRDLAS